MKTLAIIPARGGSKGLPGKNIRMLAGKPLIAWTIEAALASPSIHRTIVSTDDPEIAAVAKSHGAEVPFMRPAHLATDTATSMDVVLHALQECLGYTHVVLLQPTSPLRTTQHIEAAFQLMTSRAATSCIAITKAEESPYWMFTKDAQDTIQKLINQPAATRRQDLPDAYLPNGAIYISSTDLLVVEKSFISVGAVGYEMDASSFVDIDTADDFDTATKLVLKLQRQNCGK